MKLEYSIFKAHVIAKDLRWQYIEYSPEPYPTYLLFAQDGDFRYECLTDQPAEIVDFETSYKAMANRPILAVENDTGLQRVRNRDVEGTLAETSAYFVTGTAGSLDAGGSAFYSLDVSIPGATKLIFSPTLSYYLNGGQFRLMGDLSVGQFIKANIIFAPGFLNWYFVKNKKLTNTSREYSKTAPSKYIKYYAAYPFLSEAILIVTHEVTEAVECEFALYTYYN